MKQGVSTYSFCARPDIGLMDIPKKAKEMGFDGLELAGIWESEPATDMESVRRACEDAGIPVCGYCTSCDFSQSIPGQLQWLREEIDRAAYFSSPVLRTDIYHEDPADPYAAPVMDALRQAADYAQSKGVVLTTENHGGYFAMPERLQKLFETVNHKNFGLLADTGNFLDADTDPAGAFALLLSHIRHVHLKDFHKKDGAQLYPGEGAYITRSGNYLIGTSLGYGDAPIEKCLKLLDSVNFQGYLVHEFEGLEEPVAALTRSLAFARRVERLLPEMRWNG